MKSRIALMFLSLCLVVPLHADEERVITLSESLDMAEKTSISLEMERIILSGELRNADAVMTTFMPGISLDGSISTGLDEKGGFSGLNVGAGASASFSFIGSMATDGKVRAEKRDGAWLDYKSSYKDLGDAVTEAYWNISAAALSVDAAELSLEDARATYASVKEMYDNGLQDEFSLMQAELAMKQGEQQLKGLENSLELLKSSFRKMTGIEGDFSTEPLPSPVFLALPEPEVLFAEYSPSSLDIQSAESDLRSAGIAAQSAKLGLYVPRLSVSVGYSYSGSCYGHNDGIDSDSIGKWSDSSRYHCDTML